METLPPNIAEHIPLYGSRLLYDQGNLWKKTWRSSQRFGRQFFGLVHEYHSSNSSSPRKRLWHEFEICQELSLENHGTAFQGNRKAGQLSDRNRWHKRDWFPRFEVLVARLTGPVSRSCGGVVGLHVSLLPLCVMLHRACPIQVPDVSVPGLFLRSGWWFVCCLWWTCRAFPVFRGTFSTTRACLSCWFRIPCAFSLTRLDRFFCPRHPCVSCQWSFSAAPIVLRHCVLTTPHSRARSCSRILVLQLRPDGYGDCFLALVILLLLASSALLQWSVWTHSSLPPSGHPWSVRYVPRSLVRVSWSPMSTPSSLPSSRCRASGSCHCHFRGDAGPHADVRLPRIPMRAMSGLSSRKVSLFSSASVQRSVGLKLVPQVQHKSQGRDWRRCVAQRARLWLSHWASSRIRLRAVIRFLSRFSPGWAWDTVLEWFRTSALQDAGDVFAKNEGAMFKIWQFRCADLVQFGWWSMQSVHPFHRLRNHMCNSLLQYVVSSLQTSQFLVICSWSRINSSICLSVLPLRGFRSPSTSSNNVFTQDWRTCFKSWNCEQLWTIPRSQPTHEYSESQRNDSFCSLIHGSHYVPQETFLKVYLLEVNPPQHS